VNTDVFPAVALGDVDEDGDLDVVYGSTGTSINLQGKWALLRNEGNGTLAPAEGHGIGGLVNVQVADVTGDGWLDVLTATGSNLVWTLDVGNGAGGFLPTQTFLSGEAPQDVEVVDADLDGDPDVVTVARDSLEASVHLNPGGGDFSPPLQFRLFVTD
jgi:hypothetical protein